MTTPTIPSAEDVDAPTEHPAARRRTRSRRTLLVVAACAALLLAGGTAAAILTIGDANAAPADTERTGVPTTTTKIEQGTLSGVSKATGTLDFADSRTVGGGTGTITSVPAPGTRIGLGESLYSVDNVPVPLLHGPLPAWRGFASGMSDGPDVLQLEMSLAALGYFDREPDDEFTWWTQRAIDRWQKALGIEQSGRLDLGSVVFMPGDVRVSAVKLGVGSPAAPEILTVTSLTKRIEVDLKLSEQQLAVVGTKVDVTLPGGATTTGTVTDVGVPVEQDGKDGGDKAVTVPVGIALDDPAAADALQRAGVTVAFPSEQRENVLSVPVEALIALDSKTFGVEVVDKDGKHRELPVTTGLFADGRVEISGEGVTAGLDVVVPRS